MKRFITVVMVMVLICTVMPIGALNQVYADPSEEQLDADVLDFIRREGSLVGITYNESHDHVTIIEVGNWTILLQDGKALWGVRNVGGEYNPVQQYVQFENYDWSISMYLEDSFQDNINSEVNLIYWTEWYTQPEPEGK